MAHMSKGAVNGVLEVVNQSVQVGIGLHSLSCLLNNHAKAGGELDETMTHGVGVILESLSDMILTSECDHQICLNALRAYGEGAA